ncbi:MAG: hypothetical protein E6J72_20220 [Deltaproteobacteria bacterium]|nr:MAG: hypothetical protein E6J72_20220 [Deltaproteobacteria bacterium]
MSHRQRPRRAPRRARDLPHPPPPRHERPRNAAARDRRRRPAARDIPGRLDLRSTQEIDASGDLDLNVAIRTAVATRGRLTYSVGSGIVADSDPAREYAECRLKAEAFLRALATDGRGTPAFAAPSTTDAWMRDADATSPHDGVWALRTG